MKNIITQLAIVLTLFSVQKAFADTSTGCGLGWQVTKSMTTSAATTRGSTNATSSNTFGMTSGTSGCEKHAIVKNDQMDIHFTEANILAITAEAAVGFGEYLSGWARSQGCADSVGFEFNEVVQKNYEQIFGNSKDYSVTLSNLKSIIKKTPILAQSCSTRS